MDLPPSFRRSSEISTGSFDDYAFGTVSAATGAAALKSVSAAAGGAASGPGGNMPDNMTLISSTAAIIDLTDSDDEDDIVFMGTSPPTHVVDDDIALTVKIEPGEGVDDGHEATKKGKGEDDRRKKDKGKGKAAPLVTATPSYAPKNAVASSSKRMLTPPPSASSGTIPRLDLAGPNLSTPLPSRYEFRNLLTPASAQTRASLAATSTAAEDVGRYSRDDSDWCTPMPHDWARPNMDWYHAMASSAAAPAPTRDPAWASVHPGGSSDLPPPTPPDARARASPGPATPVPRTQTRKRKHISSNKTAPKKQQNQKQKPSTASRKRKRAARDAVSDEPQSDEDIDVVIKRIERNYKRKSNKSAGSKNAPASRGRKRDWRGGSVSGSQSEAEDADVDGPILELGNPNTSSTSSSTSFVRGATRPQHAKRPERLERPRRETPVASTSTRTTTPPRDRSPSLPIPSMTPIPTDTRPCDRSPSNTPIPRDIPPAPSPIAISTPSPSIMATPTHSPPTPAAHTRTPTPAPAPEPNTGGKYMRDPARPHIRVAAPEKYHGVPRARVVGCGGVGAGSVVLSREVRARILHVLLGNAQASADPIAHISLLYPEMNSAEAITNAVGADADDDEDVLATAASFQLYAAGWFLQSGGVDERVVTLGRETQGRIMHLLLGTHPHPPHPRASNPHLTHLKTLWPVVNSWAAATRYVRAAPEDSERVRLAAAWFRKNAGDRVGRGVGLG